MSEPSPRPSLRTLLTIYDLLFFMKLHGPRVERSRVVGYLARATGGTQATGESQARSFERVKVHMRRLGIQWWSETLFVDGRTVGILRVESLDAAWRDVNARLEEFEREREARQNASSAA